jgi:hypothetical protein
LYQTLKSICGEIRDDRPYTHCNISNTNWMSTNCKRTSKPK